jgi:hypothetical protein
MVGENFNIHQAYNKTKQGGKILSKVMKLILTSYADLS